jgi:hypothetical protein
MAVLLKQGPESVTCSTYVCSQRTSPWSVLSNNLLSSHQVCNPWEPWFTKPLKTGGKPVGLPKPPGCGFGKPPGFFKIHLKFKKIEKKS